MTDARAALVEKITQALQESAQDINGYLDADANLIHIDSDGIIAVVIAVIEAEGYARRDDVLEEAAAAMNPFLRSMISRNEAARCIRAMTAKGAVK